MSPPATRKDSSRGSNSLPIIHVRGTNYEIGFESGRLMRENIQNFYRTFEAMHTDLLPFVQTDTGREIYDGYLEVVRQNMPNYLEEIKGISDGSGVPFEQVFLMHIRSEVSIILRKAQCDIPACSTVFVNNANAEIIGHNEDNEPNMKATSYMVSAEVLSEDGKLIEKFTAFAYPGVLPGNAFSFNQAGIIFTANSMFLLDVPTRKIPRYIMNRALLAAKSPEDVERIFTAAPGLSQGCSLNVAYTRHPDAANRMRNYELLGSFEKTPNTIVDTAVVRPEDSSKPSIVSNGFLYHFNKYERLKFKEDPDNMHYISSIHRQDRAKVLPVPRTLEDVIAVLGDTGDADWPMYREPNGTDGGCTIAVAIFDLRNMTLSVYKDNPKTSKPLVVLSIP